MTFYSLVNKLFEKIGIKPKFRKINSALLSAITNILEIFYKTLHIKGEPITTKYNYHLLRFSQTLSIDKISNELGYKPRVSIDEGIKKYAKHYKEYEM